ncbi:MAG TPA: hypothetical protein VKT76_07865 [Bradyrhizobium sp.]|nr:hypothetical protein [Bradyrhizobium sp.]
MKFRMYVALIASLGAVVFVLSTQETFAVSGATSHGRFSSTRAASHHVLRHHRRPRAAFVGLGDDGFFAGPNGEPGPDAIPPNAGNLRYTNTNDVPWDWAHRYPPAVAPSGRPYVSSCPSEAVTVPDGHGGQGQVNIVRCY